MPICLDFVVIDAVRQLALIGAKSTTRQIAPLRVAARRFSAFIWSRVWERSTGDLLVIQMLDTTLPSPRWFT